MTVRFDPSSDGFRFGDGWQLSPEGARDVVKSFEASFTSALGFLAPRFEGALDLHNVEDGLCQMTQSGRPGDFGRRAAIAFAALDYFNARVLPPTLSQVEPAGRSARLDSYLRRRSGASAAVLAPALLARAGVLACIPESWIPERLVTGPLQRELNRLFGPNSAKIELDLKLPFPGGAPWLSQQTLIELKELKRHLGRSRPWPIVLIPKNRDLFDARVMVAYRYEEAGRSETTIFCYDPDFPGNTQAFHVDVTEDAAILGALSHAPGAFHPAGMFCGEYETAGPPMGFLLRLLRALRLSIVIWLPGRLVRRWRLGTSRLRRGSQPRASEQLNDTQQAGDGTPHA